MRESAWNTLRPTLVDKIIADALAKASLSDWDDEPSVAKFADEILTAKDTIAQCFIDYGDRTRAELIDSGYEPAEVRAAEEAAHEAERRGNRKPLADLLHEHWDRVGQNTRDLVEKIVRGEKKDPGPRPMTREERWAANPIHGAAADVEFLRRVFGELYPTIRPAVVRARSIEIVAERVGITVEKLQGYLRRPRGDDHRLK